MSLAYRQRDHRGSFGLASHTTTVFVVISLIRIFVLVVLLSRIELESVPKTLLCRLVCINKSHLTEHLRKGSICETERKPYAVSACTQLQKVDRVGVCRTTNGPDLVNRSVNEVIVSIATTPSHLFAKTTVCSGDPPTNNGD